MAARAGGYHYRWADGGAWRDTRSGEEFFAALSVQASARGGRALRRGRRRPDRHHGTPFLPGAIALTAARWRPLVGAERVE